MEKPDISDRFELLDKKMENIHGGGPDKTDRFDPALNMSVLSGRPPGLLDENFSPYEGYDFNERLAIVEYGGGQTPAQAHRIAYLDAFMAVLASLPYEDTEGDWLSYRINAAQTWLLDQGIERPN